MSDIQKKILDTISKAVPGMTELQKEKFLSYGEGVASMVERQNQTRQTKTVNSGVAVLTGEEAQT